MGDKNITSHDQRGGITAFEVNVRGPQQQHTGLPLRVKWAVAVTTVVGVVATIVLGVLQIT